jgi:hypothetical protein
MIALRLRVRAIEPPVAGHFLYPALEASALDQLGQRDPER